MSLLNKDSDMYPSCTVRVVIEQTTNTFHNIGRFKEIIYFQGHIVNARELNYVKNTPENQLQMGSHLYQIQ